MTHLFHRLHETIRNADRILIVTHKKPDGDAAGSSTAIIAWLMSLGKRVTAYCADPMPASYRFLDEIHRFTTDTSVFDERHDVVLMLDASSLDHAGIDEHVRRLPEGYLLACIDHHASNDGFAKLSIVDPLASSASEIVHRFFTEIGVSMNARIATSILTGIAYDTTNFTNASTSARAVDISSALVANGARMNDVLRNLWHAHTPDTLRLWGKLLARLKRYDAWDLAVTHVTNADLEPFQSEMPSGFINFLGASISDTDTVLVLREGTTGGLRGSFRTMTRNILPITASFGGGGHPKAGGFEMEETMTFDETGTVVLPERLTKRIEEVLRVGA